MTNSVRVLLIQRNRKHQLSEVLTFPTTIRMTQGGSQQKCSVKNELRQTKNNDITVNVNSKYTTRQKGYKTIVEQSDWKSRAFYMCLLFKEGAHIVVNYFC